jgi:hypothetical protein
MSAEKAQLTFRSNFTLAKAAKARWLGLIFRWGDDDVLPLLLTTTTHRPLTTTLTPGT